MDSEGVNMQIKNLYLKIYQWVDVAGKYMNRFRQEQY